MTGTATGEMFSSHSQIERNEENEEEILPYSLFWMSSMRSNEPKDVSINVAINCIYSGYDIYNRLKMQLVRWRWWWWSKRTHDSRNKRPSMKSIQLPFGIPFGHGHKYEQTHARARTHTPSPRHCCRRLTLSLHKCTLWPGRCTHFSHIHYEYCRKLKNV